MRDDKSLARSYGMWTSMILLALVALMLHGDGALITSGHSSSVRRMLMDYLGLTVRDGAVADDQESTNNPDRHREVTIPGSTVPVLIAKTSTSRWSTPSSDPAGVAYQPSTGRLILSDSEIGSFDGGELASKCI